MCVLFSGEPHYVISFYHFFLTSSQIHLCLQIFEGGWDGVVIKVKKFVEYFGAGGVKVNRFELLLSVLVLLLSF